jgi:formylglycine-generating enzyme required for sulfatase activity
LKSKWDIVKEIGQQPFPDTVISPIDGAEMVLVPEGHFVMGTSQEDFLLLSDGEQNQNPIFATEVPSRKVYVESFYIDRYPVTNYQFGQFMSATGHTPPLLWEEMEWNKPMQPVVFIGWDSARAYAAWAGKSLPDEAQWEKAGRGTDGRHWSWGNQFLQGRCNSREFGLNCTSEIGLFHEGISPFGCYDMCGNVWEMCEGQWIENHPPMRGGCFLGTSSFVRITCRWTPEDTDVGAHWLGFRCVKTIPIEE